MRKYVANFSKSNSSPLRDTAAEDTAIAGAISPSHDCANCRSGCNSHLRARVQTGVDAERVLVNQRMENDLLKTTSVLGECVHNRIARGVEQLPLDNPRIL